MIRPTTPPVVTYSYSVSGVEVTKKREFSPKDSGEEAEDSLKQITKEGITVHYNPQKPEQSFTQYAHYIEGSKVGDLIYWFFLLLFFVPGVYFIIVAFSHP